MRGSSQIHPNISPGGSHTVWVCTWLAIAVTAAAGLVSGCGTRQLPRTTTASRPLPDERPKDLSIAASVFSPRVPLPSGGLPRSLKPARYIIEADGVLRVSQGSQATEFPARARQLSPRQVDQLWRILRDSTLLNEGNPARVEDPEGLARSGDRTTAMLYIAFAGQRTSLRILLDRSTSDAIEAERFIDRLAELAWVE